MEGEIRRFPGQDSYDKEDICHIEREVKYLENIKV